jgi:hypothetical protein
MALLLSARRRIVKWLIRAAAEGGEKRFEQERSHFPESRVEQVAIYGDSLFADGVTQSFSLLRTRYPFGYRLVQRYVRAVVQSRVDARHGQNNAVIFVEPAADGGLPLSPSRFAAALVRRGVAIRKLLHFQIWRSPRSALGSLKAELHAMRLLECDSKYFHPQMNKIITLEKKLSHHSTRHAAVTPAI